MFAALRNPICWESEAKTISLPPPTLNSIPFLALQVNPVWLMELLFYYMISLLVLFGNYLRVQKGRGKGKGSKAAKAAAKKAKSKSKSKKEL